MDKIISHNTIDCAIRSLEYVGAFSEEHETGMLDEVVVGGEAINTQVGKTNLGKIMLEMNRKSAYDISKHPTVEYFDPNAYVKSYEFKDDFNYNPVEGYAAYQQWFANTSAYRARNSDSALCEILSSYTELARALLCEEADLKDYSFPYPFSN